MTERASRPDDEPAGDEPADDEIVSAVLDGEGTADEVARVLAEPRLAARLEVMRGVAVATGAAVPTPPHDVVHDTIARVLTRASSSASTAPAPTTEVPAEVPAEYGAAAPVARVVTMTARRSPSRRTLSIAAAVLAAVLAPLVVSRIGGDGAADQEASSGAAAELRARAPEDAATGTDEAEDEGENLDDAGGTAAGDAPSELAVPADPGTPSPTAPDPGAVEVIDLGSLPDEDALRRAVLELETTEAAGLPPPTTVVAADDFDARDPARCLPEATERGAVDGPLEVVQAWARYRGEPVTVYITALHDGSREVVAVAALSCAERARLLVSG